MYIYFYVFFIPAHAYLLSTPPYHHHHKPLDLYGAPFPCSMRPVRYMQIKICIQCIQRDFDKIQIKSGKLVIVYNNQKNLMKIKEWQNEATCQFL